METSINLYFLKIWLKFALHLNGRLTECLSRETADLGDNCGLITVSGPFHLQVVI